VPVNPQGTYRIGGGTIRPSEGFNLPRPAGQVVVEAQTGSVVKHWVGFGLTIGGAVSAVSGALLYASAPGPDIYGDTAARDTAHVGGVVYMVVGLILLAVGIPLSMSSTSVDVR